MSLVLFAILLILNLFIRNQQIKAMQKTLQHNMSDI